MSRFVLASAAIAHCVSGNVVHLDQFLNDYLGRVDVPFSLQNISVEGGYMDLSGECSNISLGAVDARNRDFNLGLNVSGLSLGCDIQANVRLGAPILPGISAFNTTIGFFLDHGWVNFPFTVHPIAVDVDNCTGKLPGRHHIAVAGLPNSLDQMVAGSIGAIITDPQTFCAIVENVLKQLPPAMMMAVDYSFLQLTQDARDDPGDAHTVVSLASGDGACTSDEQAALADPQTVGPKANDCGVKAFNIFTGKFDHDKFDDCFSSDMGVSKTCAECYAVTGEYGAHNCQADCLAGWCKSGCLTCTKPAQADLATCTGFPAATAEPCDGTMKEEVQEGACTSDEQSALSDPQTVGPKAKDCGVKAINNFFGDFDHDKFDDCFTSAMGVSKTCAECYAVTGEYGTHNCDCLAGWCKSGCLSCTEPAQADLATCTGFQAATVDPCEETAMV